MNKLKLISYIIIAEVSVIVVLLLVLLLNFDLSDGKQYEIKINHNRIIYSKDKSEPFTGKMQDTLNNKLIVQFSVVNGMKQGEFAMLTLDGNLAVQGFMNKNKNDGIWKYFYANGQIECEGEFDNDEPSGRWLWYYQNGVKKCEGIYLNGKPEGRWTKFNEDGSTSLLINYVKGEIISFVKLDKPTRI